MASPPGPHVSHLRRADTHTIVSLVSLSLISGFAHHFTRFLRLFFLLAKPKLVAVSAIPTLEVTKPSWLGWHFSHLVPLPASPLPFRHKARRASRFTTKLSEHIVNTTENICHFSPLYTSFDTRAIPLHDSVNQEKGGLVYPLSHHPLRVCFRQSTIPLASCPSTSSDFALGSGS